MDKAASLMNDTAKTIYTYAAMVPYINIAMQELQEEFELNAIPVTEAVSSIINMPAGSSAIIFNGVGVPSLPNDMIEPLQLWERNGGTNPFIPMKRKDFLPGNMQGTQINQFQYYVWQSNEIRVLPSNAVNDIKIDYIKQLFQPVVNENSFINIINAQTFLEFRTAALLAEFIERNISSANALNTYAVMRMDTAKGISSKGKQKITTRRRPFRAGYKRGGWVT